MKLITQVLTSCCSAMIFFLINPEIAFGTLLTQTQRFINTENNVGEDLFEQFDQTLGILQDVRLTYNFDYTAIYNCPNQTGCSINYSRGLDFYFPNSDSIGDGEVTDRRSNSIGPVTVAGNGIDSVFININNIGREISLLDFDLPLSIFIGTGRVGEVIGSSTFSIGNGGSIINQVFLNDLTLSYDYIPLPDSEPIPTQVPEPSFTSALLLGIVSLGIAIRRSVK
ncbi:hypothetical protein cce_2541 [Crocosphaera subtropica ATCC 51142]|uniref:PEP-CTERM protein-sorting domain-containing protein n=1 Tax=Crocosphaera subtropica (strain ATCC 51142 / BH68) TaxID=43989 RepID=B1WSA3_CROS5|nr:PEP-CTERM sorting domain-containing protein [Crocosphaera subtropica]ACB51889.1 hypothetical protein cce_2541 [Crocosphaera subtropica ATCC 51142]